MLVLVVVWGSRCCVMVFLTMVVIVVVTVMRVVIVIIVVVMYVVGCCGWSVIALGLGCLGLFLCIFMQQRIIGLYALHGCEPVTMSLIHR